MTIDTSPIRVAGPAAAAAWGAAGRAQHHYLEREAGYVSRLLRTFCMNGASCALRPRESEARERDMLWIYI